MVSQSDPDVDPFGLNTELRVQLAETGPLWNPGATLPVTPCRARIDVSMKSESVLEKEIVLVCHTGGTFLWLTH